MSADKKQVVVIKRRRHNHDDEHHGGVWKIAYADFVTALMALFLCLWLVNVTTKDQREGIAKFFQTTSILDLPSGTGVLEGGPSMMEAGENRQSDIAPAPNDGGPQADQDSASLDAAEAAAMRNAIERQRFEAVKAEVERLASSGELSEFASNLSVEITPEGLRINIFDRDGEQMFAPAATEPTPRLSRILRVIGSVLTTVPNRLVIAGHTDGGAYRRGTYGNWELSSDRANSARRHLEESGVATDRLLRVEGRAAADLLVAGAPSDPRNRRIAVTVLRTDIAAPPRGAAPPLPPAPTRR